MSGVVFIGPAGNKCGGLGTRVVRTAKKNGVGSVSYALFDAPCDVGCISHMMAFFSYVYPNVTRVFHESSLIYIRYEPRYNIYIIIALVHA